MDEKKEIWNLNNLFNGRTEQQILENVLLLKNKIIEKKPLLNAAPSLILEIIKLHEELEIDLSRITSYYGLRSHANVNDEEANAKLDYYNQLGSEISNEIMFFELWFMSLDDETTKKIINDEELKAYKQYLKDLIKLKPHTKTEEIEQILNIKNITGRGAFANIYETLTSTFKFEFEEQKLTQEEIVSKYTDKNAETREKAYTTVLSMFKENSLTLSEIYKNIVLAWNNENQKIRNYTKAIEPRHKANDLTDEVVQTMIQVIKENTQLFQEYFKLKKEFLEKKGQPHKYSRYHIYAPYEYEAKEYKYEESKKITLETYKEFDEQFYEYAKKTFDEKHVHSHPEKGKRSGAFCSAPNNKVTPYVLLNHTNKLRDLFTMMHELGHAIHGIYTYEQPNLVHHPVLPLAETASILGETILAKKLLKTENKEEKASLLLYLLDHYYASIIRQTYFVIFEENAHKKIMRGVTKTELDEDYYELLKEQFGEMEIPELFKHEWNYIPHIHNTPFYCYAYSWGNLLVLALYAEYEKNPEFKEQIKKILRAGASKETLEILKDAGIEPTNKEFWQQAFNIIKQELQELKEIIRE